VDCHNLLRLSRLEVLEWFRPRSFRRETTLPCSPLAAGGTPVWLDEVERQNGYSRKLIVIRVAIHLARLLLLDRAPLRSPKTTSIGVPVKWPCYANSHCGHLQNRRWLMVKMFWMRKIIILAICAATLISALGCGDQVRVSSRELTGTYAMEFQNVSYSFSKRQQVLNYNVTEEFILNPDHTYIQRFSSYPRTFTNRGTWKASNRFLGGTEVELSGVDRSGYDPPNSPSSYSTLSLEVHRHYGRLRLALYEKADWTYYERVQ
jgi:hypothetical protein